LRSVAALSVALLLSGVAVIVAAGQSSKTASNGYVTRVLPLGPPSVALPLVTANLVHAVDVLAWYARVPMGFEGLDEDAMVTAAPSGELHFGGDRVGEALDKIVARQPRYSWSEEHGVIHLRPTAARTDERALLSQPIAAFELHDVTLSEALLEVRFHLRPELRGAGILGSGPQPRQLGLQRFSVAVANTTLLGLLDAIILAHGAASWHVTYTNDPRSPYSVGFATFDGWSQTW
jgi:hypothetical protein